MLPFSRYGTLLATAEAFIRSSVAGYFAEELSAILHVGAQDVLRHLVQQNRIARELISGLFLYTSTDPATWQRQRLTRRSNQSVPTVVDATRLEVSPDEMKAAIILFYSLLDEQQRRLYAGLESMRLGHGGDSVLAEFLASIRTPSPAAAASCWIRMSRSAGSGSPAPDVKRWKKNARGNRSHRNPAGTRHRRRSHHRHSMDPQDACRIAELLRQLDIEISANTVARLLHDMDFSLRVNRKAMATDASPDRDQQFRYISSLRTRFERQGLPIISVDTKKRELVGNFRNNGVKWCRAPVRVNDHDFRSDAIGVAIPYGIYDLLANRGSVFVGVSHDTEPRPPRNSERVLKLTIYKTHPGTKH